ncbi:MAG: hypothetical protein H7263_01755 [Candidatus Sericytochromatia bacterium]|nr:hypothetical protein [Candidatus Sericytochromatia bacterium]
MNKFIIGTLVSLFSFSLISAGSVQANENYTSVIIDCSNMGLLRAMSPVVINEKGDELYPGDAAATMDMKAVLAGKIVNYEKSIEKAIINDNAGKHPLIIKASSVKGILSSDPVLSRLDTIKLSLANNEAKFLGQRKVILIY